MGKGKGARALRAAVCLMLALSLLGGMAVTGLAAKIPYAAAKGACEGGTEYLDKYGVTRAAVLAELGAHENDGYYLGTTVMSGDWQSPRGDVSYNGTAGMNCAGFVSYVLRKCGLDVDAAVADMRKESTFSDWGSPRPCAPLAAASNYYNLVRYGHLKSYVFPDRFEMFSSGLCEKGDVILRFWTNQVQQPMGEDNHIMFFWGDTPYENKVWHSADGRNHIGPTGDTTCCYILIKFAPDNLDASALPDNLTAGFTDVTEEDWFAQAVAYVRENDLMNGMGDGRFDPAGTFTRAQTVTLLYRMAGSPESDGETGFADVAPGDWYAPQIAWASGAGIVTGYDAAHFGPDDPIRRQDLACLLRRYCTYMKITLPEEKVRMRQYADRGELSAYAHADMQWALNTGLLVGDGQNLLPLDTANRAQAATIFMRLHSSIAVFYDA